MSAADSRPASADRPLLTIDLAAIAANWRLLRDRAAGSEVAAVVKADAYGLGHAQVAPALFAAGARTFFVARLAEGEALREVLPAARIFVLDGLALGAPARFLRADLVPVLNQPAELALWRAQAGREGRPLPAALQLDTGMTRLGFSARQMAALDAADLAGFAPLLIMSHLACADEPEHELNARQRERFQALLPRLPAAGASLANSAGIVLGPAYHFDLCRPGIALWGGNPLPGRANPMHPVVRLSAPVLQVHEVDAQGTVGYGATCRVRPGQRVATVALGYADGFLRAAGPRAMARLAGRDVPIAGRVSMDLITLDVTALPPGDAQPGMLADLIWGPDGIDRVAAAGETIPYEILTRLGGRFERRYLVADGQPGGAVSP